MTFDNIVTYSELERNLLISSHIDAYFDIFPQSRQPTQMQLESHEVYF